MKRYLIFAAIGPFIGGLLLLFATTVASGYWTETNWGEVGKFFATFGKTLLYSYLFGIVPALMLGAVDDILIHLPRIRAVFRMLILGGVRRQLGRQRSEWLASLVRLEKPPRGSLCRGAGGFGFRYAGP